MTRSCSVDLTLDLTAPHCARTVACLLLRHWGVVDDEALHGTAIVVTELVTNALVHSDDGGPIRLDLQVREDALTLSVTDRSGTLPLQRVADQHAEDGRGLTLVSQLASTWGIEPLPVGKRVFARLPLPASHCA